jgi:hypothetical protein
VLGKVCQNSSKNRPLRKKERKKGRKEERDRLIDKIELKMKMY